MAHQVAAGAVRSGIIGRPCRRPPGVNGPCALEVEAAQVVVHAAQPEPARVGIEHDACVQRLIQLVSLHLSIKTLVHCPHKIVPVMVP